MKICHVVYSLEMGGAEVLVAQLCRIQRANGHEVSICAYSQLGAVGEVLRAEGFPIYVPGEAHPATTMVRYLRQFLKTRPDVVHCHNPAPTLQAALSAKLAGVGCVVATRHSLVSPPYERAAEIKFSIAALFCNWITGVCEITCENLRHAPFALKGRIVRVYNGTTPVDPDAVDLPQREGFTLLFIGRLAVVKDLPTLLHAVKIGLQHVPDLRLWIVGDGPVRSDLETLAQELGIEKHVRFWGLQLETAKYYRGADAFVMSSTSEGVPMSLLQSMSIGLPTVTTDVGGMAEVLRLAECGILTPVADANAMAAALVAMAGDRELRERFSEKARIGYVEHFTLESMDAAYMKLYREPRPVWL
jgi:glycosyltransferase involved in cell wall biosynthesis